MNLSKTYSLNRYDPKRRVIDMSYFPDVQQDFHCDKFPKISIVLSGELKEVVGKKEIFASTGGMVIKPNSVRHKNQFGPKGARVVSVLVEEDFINSLSSKGNSPWRWYLGLPNAKAVWHFLYSLKYESQDLPISESIIELVSNIWEPNLPSIKFKPPWLNLITEKINDEYTNSGLLVRQLADEVDIHPVYLARVFRKFHHCSIKDYIQRLRLENAMHALASSQEAIVHIAYNEGFADQSHLTRNFKSAFGLSPGNFRKFVKTF